MLETGARGVQTSIRNSVHSLPRISNGCVRPIVATANSAGSACGPVGCCIVGPRKQKARRASARLVRNTRADHPPGPANQPEGRLFRTKRQRERPMRRPAPHAESDGRDTWRLTWLSSCPELWTAALPASEPSKPGRTAAIRPVSANAPATIDARSTTPSATGSCWTPAPTAYSAERADDHICGFVDANAGRGVLRAENYGSGGTRRHADLRGAAVIAGLHLRLKGVNRTRVSCAAGKEIEGHRVLPLTTSSMSSLR